MLLYIRYNNVMKNFIEKYRIKQFTLTLIPFIITCLIYVQYDPYSYKMYLDLVIYFTLLYIPLFSMVVCTGWSANNMSCSRCMFHNEIIGEIADSFYNMVFISAFTFFIPFVMYYFMVLGISSLLQYIVSSVISFI